MKKSIISLCFALVFAGYALAQTSPSHFAIYEDNVKPSMDATYKEALKKLKSACEQHKAGLSWSSAAFDDGSYSHLVPIKGLADLDKNMMADLESKMGKESLGAIFAELNKCVESQSSFAVSMLPNMSYMTPPAGENYRDLFFWQVLPGKEAEGEKIIMEWKKLYEDKKAPNGFVTYKVLFGREPGYAFVFWGKNGVDQAAKTQKTNELFGEEGGKLWAKTQAITKKYYSKRAWILPDFTYTSGATASN